MTSRAPASRNRARKHRKTSDSLQEMRPAFQRAAIDLEEGNQRSRRGSSAIARRPQQIDVTEIQSAKLVAKWTGGVAFQATSRHSQFELHILICRSELQGSQVQYGHTRSQLLCGCGVYRS